MTNKKGLFLKFAKHRPFLSSFSLSVMVLCHSFMLFHFMRQHK